MATAGKDTTVKYCVYILAAAFILCGPPPARSADTIEMIGDVLQITLPASALGYTLESGDREGSAQLLRTFAFGNAVTHTLKPLINSTRPNGGEYSFPSGHTTSAFLGASFYQRRYGWKIGLPMYCLAAFVGYSRIESDNHHLEDVLGGAAIGIGSAYLFTRPGNRVQVMPYITETESGVAARIKW